MEGCNARRDLDSYLQSSDCTSPASALVEAVAEWLRSDAARVLDRNEAGFVPLASALAASHALRELAGGDKLDHSELEVVLEDALLAADEPIGGTDRVPPVVEFGRVGSDSTSNGSMRLRSTSERVLIVAEQKVQQAPYGSMSLLDVLRSKPVDKLLGDVDDIAERLAALRSSIAASALIEVRGSMVMFKHQWSDDSSWWTTGDWWAMQWSPIQAWPTCELDNGATALLGITAASKCEAGDREPYKERICSCLANILENLDSNLACRMCSDGSVSIADLFEMHPHFAAKVFSSPAFVLQQVLSSSQARITADPDAQTVRLLSLDERLTRIVEEIIRTRRAVATKPARTTPGGQVGCGAGGGQARGEGAIGVGACGGVVTPHWSTAPTSVAGLEELLRHPAVAELLAGAVPGSSAEPSDGSEARVERLRLALKGSDVLEVTEIGVSLRPPSGPLRAVVEAVLLHEPRAQALMESEGEVSVQWILEQQIVQKMLARCAISGFQAAAEALRAAVENSNRYELTFSRMSIRIAGPGIDGRSWAKVGTAGGDADTDQELFAFARRVGVHMGCTNVAQRSKSPRVRRRSTPTEKDASCLRKLLAFYFEAFNLQHARVLMDVLESRRRQARRFLAKDSIHMYRFQLAELKALPRVGRLLARYDDDAAAALFAAALQGQQGIPIQLYQGKDERNAAKGAWAAATATIAPVALPDLRFIETTHPTRAEVLPLVSRGPNSSCPLQSLPSNAICVVSYSVSSDLSHSHSPKAQSVLQAIADGMLDPSAMSWELRQQRIVRQLLLHGPDIICLQGLQSIGFSERCSETQLAWFACEDEPSSNHLVHLYRELDKANYAVAFAPTVKLPGSAVVCFGNAVFWKRSRWQLKRNWTVSAAAVCVALTSHFQVGERRPLIVCSSKSAAVYAREWARNDGSGVVGDQELMDTFFEVESSIEEAAQERNARMIWTGDFGCGSHKLMDFLSVQRFRHPATTSPGSFAPAWRSAYGAVLGEEPSKTIMRDSDDVIDAVDFIFQNAGLECVAVLGSFREQYDLIDFLRSGYPSDHILLMALFVTVDVPGADESSGDGNNENTSGDVATPAKSGSPRLHHGEDANETTSSAERSRETLEGPIDLSPPLSSLGFPCMSEE